MPFLFNPVSGNFDLVSGSTAATSAKEYTIERFTLNSTDISNGYITLTNTPSNGNLVRLTIIEGIEQDNGVDFAMLADDGGRRLSWNGLGLDGILTQNDKLIVWFNKNI